MDLSYQSPTPNGGSSRSYSQHQQTGCYRFASNGQVQTGPTLFGNANLNTVFGSGIPPVFSSGNQFNFPLRSNRASSGGNNSISHRINSSPNRNISNNHNYGVYSKPTPLSIMNGIIQNQQYSSGSSNSFPYTNRNNVKQRNAASKSMRWNNSTYTKTVQETTSALAGTSLDHSGEGDSSPEPQYRIFKRGDSESFGSVTAEVESVNESDGRSTPVQSESEHQLRNNSNIDQELDDVSSGCATATGSSENPNGGSSRVVTNQTNSRTPISLIAGLAKFHGLTVEYRLINETGPPHCPTFTVALHLGGETYEGVGLSIKKAQLAAASVAVESSPLPRPPQRNHPKRNYASWQGNGHGNWPLAQLTALAEEMNQPLHFVNHPVTVINPFRKVTPVARVAVHIGDRIFTGEGNSFNAAKSMGIMVTLKALVKVKKDQESKTSTENRSGSAEDEPEEESKSPISVVYEMAFKRNMSISYNVVKEVGPAHSKVFTVQCKVGEELETESDGFTKQQAKKLASEMMIIKLKEILVPGENNLLKALQREMLKPKVVKRKPAIQVVKDVEKVSVSPISRLIQIAHLRKFKEPEFVLVSMTSSEDTETTATQQTAGRQHRRISKLRKPHFVIEVRVGPHVCQGEGPNKKAAKKLAADRALVLLGYPSSESKKESSKAETQGAGANPTSSSSEEPSNSKSSPNLLQLISGRQIVPGLLVLRNQATTSTTVETQESDQPQTIIPRAEASMPFPLKAPHPPSVHEAVNKLSYLAQLLGVKVSYSDFPKKNEYLSVVSLGTMPPHFSHGIGPTLEDAQNNAALQVLAELSHKGLENEPKTPESAKQNLEDLSDKSKSQPGEEIVEASGFSGPFGN